MRRFRIWNHLASSLWFVPVMCVAAGVALSFGTIAIDRHAGGFIPRSLSGDPDAALAVLTTVAVAMVTLTTLVLTITMVVVQLAMGQFTPRVLRTILRDRPSQFAVGVFVATFAHAMLVMREVEHPSGGRAEGFVPGFAIVVAYVLILISIVVLVSYVNHVGQSLRAASLIDSVGDDTRDRILELFTESEDDGGGGPAPPGEPTRVVPAGGSGVLFKIGEADLVELARREDVAFVVRPRLGDFVPQGAPLVDVHGSSAVRDEEIRRLLVFGKDRTLHDDVAYGLKMLVDVAVRSVSPAMGDPSTAVQAIDRIHDCLRLLATRPIPSGVHVDESGRVRLVLQVLSWEGFVHIALDELRNWSTSSIQVTRRIAAMLDDLIDVAPEDRRPPLERQRQLLDAAAKQAFEVSGEGAWAVEPDQQGLGSGPNRILQRAR